MASGNSFKFEILVNFIKNNHFGNLSNRLCDKIGITVFLELNNFGNISKLGSIAKFDKSILTNL